MGWVGLGEEKWTHVHLWANVGLCPASSYSRIVQCLARQLHGWHFAAQVGYDIRIGLMLVNAMQQCMILVYYKALSDGAQLKCSITQATAKAPICPVIYHYTTPNLTRCLCWLKITEIEYRLLSLKC